MVIDTTPTPPIVTFDNTSVTYIGGYTSGQASIPNLPLYIFAVNSAGIPIIAPYSVAEKIGGFKIEKNGVLVCDFIPVRIGTEGAMYDRVSGQLFRNAGTGAFTIGPDKTSWTNPYVTNGLVAMWDGEWNAGGGVHDASATVWKDLVGSRDATLAGDISWGVNYIHRDATPATSITLPGIEIKPGFAIDYCMALTNNGDGNFRDFATTSGLRMEIVRLTNGGIQRYYRNSKDAYVSRTGTTPFGLSTGAQQILFGWDSDGGYGAYNGGSVWYDQTENTILKDYGTIQSLAVGKSGTLYENAKYHRICIYSRALTVADIAANYAIDQARFNLP
jgi:hypothetical protein